MAIQKNVQPDKARGSGDKAGESGKQESRLITVHTRPGYKKDESPRSFEIDGRKLTVLSVKKRWQLEATEGRHRKFLFRVHAHDGRSYDIALDEGTGEWTLEPWTG